MKQMREKKELINSNNPNYNTHSRKHSMFNIREKARKLDNDFRKYEKLMEIKGNKLHETIKVNNMLIESVEAKLDILRQINLL